QGFAVVQALYAAQPSFRAVCNGTISGITENLYAHDPHWQGYDFTPSTTFCNFGFYQQYPMEMLLAGASTTDAKAFCDAVGKALKAAVPGTEAECYRGIGRGL